MRVIAGTFRGRRLEPPEGQTTRPITDRVKETLFNILGHRFGTPGELPAIDVLDVFAGTGSLGIEAVSRGARRCVFVERDRRALRGLRENLRHLDLLATCPVRTDNAWTMRPPEVAAGFDLVFVDPPYRDVAQTVRVLDLLDRLGPRLSETGVIVFRCESRYEVPMERLHGLRCVDSRVYGRMRLDLIAREGTGEAEAGPTEYDGAVEDGPPPEGDAPPAQ